jgi:hypothetical protein
MFVFTFAFEPVDLVHVFRFMISSVQEDAFGIQPCMISDRICEARLTLTLVSEECHDHFYRPRSPINKVAVKEQTVCLGRLARQLEEMQYIVELPYGNQ